MNFNFEKKCKDGTNHSCQTKLEKMQTSKIVTIIQNAYIDLNRLRQELSRKLSDIQ